MHEFRTNKGPDLTIPVGWHEMTIDQYIRMQTEFDGNFFTMLSILTGWAKEDLEDLDPDAEPLLSEAMSWIVDPKQIPDWDKLEKPDWFQIGSLSYKVPKDTGYETLAQKLTLDSLYADYVDNNKSLIELMPMALAIYFEPIVSSEKYSQERAEEFCDIIKDARVIDAYPIANFFLTKSRDSILYGKKASKKTLRKMRKKLVLKSSKKKSEFIP